MTITSSLGPDGYTVSIQSPVSGAWKPLYLFGDSLLARTTRELVIGGGTIDIAAKTMSLSATALVSPPGTPVRVYGFADDRLNFSSVIRHVSGVITLDMPADRDYTGLSTTILSNAALSGGPQRVVNEDIQIDLGLMAWASAAAGKQWKYTNLARGGYTSALLTALLPSLLVGLPIGHFLLEGGVNTVKNGETASQVAANYDTMIRAIRAAGHGVTLTTPTTFSSALASYATYNDGLMRQAVDMRRLASTYGCKLLDLQAIWIDGTSADGQPKTGYVNTDGIHWAPKFGQTAAQLLATHLESLDIAYTPMTKLLSLRDCKYTSTGTARNASSNNVLTNGELFGSAGALPTGWTSTLTGAPTLVYTKSASDLGSDGTFQIDYSGASGSNALIQSPTFHADIAPLQTVQFFGELELPADVNLSRFVAGVILTLSDGSSAKQIGLSSLENTYLKAGTYLVASKPWIMPAGVTASSAKAFIQIVTGTTLTNALFKARQFKVEVTS